MSIPSQFLSTFFYHRKSIETGNIFPHSLPIRKPHGYAVSFPILLPSYNQQGIQFLSHPVSIIKAMDQPVSLSTVLTNDSDVTNITKEVT
jgi:hypothetical protein